MWRSEKRGEGEGTDSEREDKLKRERERERERNQGYVETAVAGSLVASPLPPASASRQLDRCR
jgi:hypothetical protein